MVNQTLTAESFPGARLVIKRGLPQGIWLMVGPPGGGKSTYCKQFIYEGLRAGQDAIWVSTEESPSLMIEGLRSLDPPLRETDLHKHLRIVDCYSWRAGEKSETPFAVSNPSNLNDTNIVIESARKGLTNFRYVLDSISSLALSAGGGAMQKFLQISIARLRSANASGICVAELGAHEELFMNYLRFAFDGIMEMEYQEDGDAMRRTFRIFSMRGVGHTSNRHEFTLDEKGISFRESSNDRSGKW